MNNTQQAGETAFVEKHMAVIREKMKGSMIEMHIQSNRERLRASIKHFLDGGNVNGEFHLSLMKMMNPAILSPTPAPGAVEAKAKRTFLDTLLENYQIAKSAANEPEVAFPGMSKMEAVLEIYEDMIELYKAWQSAGHAEGQKATVEAKSAGVWVKASERLPSKSSRGIYNNVISRYSAEFIKLDEEKVDGYFHEYESGEVIFYYTYNDCHGNPYNLPSSGFHRIEWLDETATSHAEGEKGAVGYWQRRCELAEAYLHESPCDPDITTDQTAAWEKYRAFIKENET